MGDAERGSTTVELALLLPAVFLVMFLGLQAALYFHARTVAITAATEGAKAAAVEQGSASDGAAAALSFVADAGGDDVLPGAGATGTMTATAVTIVVTGSALSVIPGWAPDVRQHVTAPRERLTS
ncbi:TadE family protein [Isoptericola sp. NPDC019482]|uniref:TadE family protein n=1 Tax=Isoptericola sp. NPDC019482 TaxID=3154688 RepID=UPI0034995890